MIFFCSRGMESTENLTLTYSILDKFAGLNGGGGPYTGRMQAIRTANQIGYWRMSEAAGGVSLDLSPKSNLGAYTGVTLGQAGVGDGLTCPLFDGNNDYNNLDSVGFAADWDGDEFTVAGWLKVSAGGIWTDGLQHNALTISVDANNLLYLCSAVGNNSFGFRFKSGGVDKTSHVTGIVSTGWLHAAMTVSLTADEKIVYWDGLKSGNIGTGLGSWVGAPGTAIIGAGSLDPFQPWDGWQAHWLIWNCALTPAEVLRSATR
jgi:hypothetical protein